MEDETKAEKARVRSRAWAAANPDRNREKAREWAREHSEANRAKVLAWQKANVERMREKGREWNRAHPAEVKANTHKRRALMKGCPGIHTAADIKAQYSRQNGKCFYCEQKVDKYHVDHVIPLSAGGSNGPENIVIACPACNMKKSNKHPMDFCGRLL
jgi:5-methylcytosine-specific restriction endonuclease McrA